MDHYIGLDISLKETHICVVDGAGAVLARGRETTHPEFWRRRSSGLRRPRGSSCLRRAASRAGCNGIWRHSGCRR
jgi:hypothetical protein